MPTFYIRAAKSIWTRLCGRSAKLDPRVTLPPVHQSPARRRLQLAFAALLTIPVLVFHLRLYTPDSSGADSLARAVEPQLRFIKRELDAGSARRMQRLFPEGYFFNYALFGLAWAELGLSQAPQSALRQEALREARVALDAVACRSFMRIFSSPCGDLFRFPSLKLVEPPLARATIVRLPSLSCGCGRPPGRLVHGDLRHLAEISVAGQAALARASGNPW